METQITVRARDCAGHYHRPCFIGETLAYSGQHWTVVGLFLGADQVTNEIEEYLVLERNGEEGGRVL
jgi:hypothetical protein